LLRPPEARADLERIASNPVGDEEIASAARLALGGWAGEAAPP
jgi:hypothetical protein